MRRLLIVAAVGMGVLVLLVGASGYVVKALVEGSSRELLLTELSRRAGAAITVDHVEFDLASWYRLEPALRLDDVAIANPPGFRAAPLATARSISLQLALRPLLERRFEVASLAVIGPILTLEQNSQGASNLETFLEGLGGSGPAGAGPRAEDNKAIALTIGQISLEGGELRLLDADIPVRLRDVNLRLTNLAPGRPFAVALEAGLYAGKQSRASFEGTVGPLAAGSMPIAGQGDLRIAMAEIPPEIRDREFGRLLSDPGPALIELNGKTGGDLAKAISADARLRLAGFSVGPEPGRRLPLKGEAPLRLVVRKPLARPVIELRTSGARLQLGQGEWKGGLAIVAAGGIVRGRSQGSIGNIDIDQFLGAFTNAAGKLSGEMEMPAYTLQFAGRDAQGIRRSLSGEGEVVLVKGKVRFLDLVARIRDAVERRPGEARTGETEFTTLRAALELANGEITVPTLTLDGPALQAQGNGRVTFDRALEFRLNTLVRGRLAELLGRRPVANAPAEASVPVDIAGTLDAPQVRPNIAGLAIGTGLNYLEQLLRRRRDQPKKE